MRIVAVRKNNFGVGHYRITHPMIAMQNRGHEISIIEAGQNMKLCNEWLISDILLLQQQFDLGWFSLVRSLPEGSYLDLKTGSSLSLRPKIVMEIDDLIWKRNPNSDRDKERDKQLKRDVETILPMVDGIICSTPELASELDCYNGNVFVVPNAIDFGIRDWETRFSDKETEGQIVIGYTGATFHKGDDVLPFRNALLDTLAKHPECCFVVPMGVEWDWCKQHPQIIGLEATPFHAFPQLVSMIDIGVAPLLDHPFNHCKSELKLIEYGAWGIPYVASNISPYRRYHVQSGQGGGYLCTTYTEWMHAFETLVSRPLQRRAMGDWTQEYTRSVYSLDKVVVGLEAALLHIVGTGTKCEINLQAV